MCGPSQNRLKIRPQIAYYILKLTVTCRSLRLVRYRLHITLKTNIGRFLSLSVRHVYASAWFGFFFSGRRLTPPEARVVYSIKQVRCSNSNAYIQCCNIVYWHVVIII